MKRKTCEKVTRRRDRVNDLVLIDGYDDSGEIADLLIEDGVVESRSRASVLRLVQSDMALIRDRTEASRYFARRLYALREFRRIAEDDSVIEVEQITPKGDVVTSSRPRWPSNVRTRALAYFSAEAEALARVAAVDTNGKRHRPAESAARPRFTGAVPVDLSELPREDREAIGKAMREFPGAEGNGHGTPN